MADRTIGSLTAATTISDSDLLVMEQANEAKKVTGLLLKSYATADIIGASATTLPAGSSATASFDPQTKILVFGIPQGIEGEQGPKGDT